MKKLRMYKISISDLGLPAESLIRIINELPDGSEIVRTVSTTEGKTNILYLVVNHFTFDLTPEASPIPVYIVNLPWRFGMVEFTRAGDLLPSRPSQVSPISAVWDRCHCDLDYTGMKTHYPQCPLSKKIR